MPKYTKEEHEYGMLRAGQYPKQIDGATLFKSALFCVIGPIGLLALGDGYVTAFTILICLVVWAAVLVLQYYAIKSSRTEWEERYHRFATEMQQARPPEPVIPQNSGPSMKRPFTLES